MLRVDSDAYRLGRTLCLAFNVLYFGGLFLLTVLVDGRKPWQWLREGLRRLRGRKSRDPRHPP